MRSWGIGLFVFGLVLDIGGTITYAMAAANTGATWGGIGNGATTVESVGEALWVGGGALTAAGIIMWWIGGSEVPGPEPARIGWLHSIVPYVSPTKGGTSAGLSLAF
jgi:hypothetical protein